MLSRQLDCLLACVRRHRAAGEPIGPVALTGMEAMLEALVDQARRLEDLAVPAAARRLPKDLPEEVVEMADYLHRHRVRRGVSILPRRPDGGDAA